ncbi:hypothetical protein NDU88_005779 [Pleurodeles waltl]|uniref:Uncharacterized protein n=1 Tax=Pleurodeles waltl TaxID=8319 RepID=A0AAV7NQ15_PLEWA|nr:hypothetical protein NDU88_005779 [Pleurodeles waltl]
MTGLLEEGVCARITKLADARAAQDAIWAHYHPVTTAGVVELVIPACSGLRIACPWVLPAAPSVWGFQGCLTTSQFQPIPECFRRLKQMQVTHVEDLQLGWV